MKKVISLLMIGLLACQFSYAKDPAKTQKKTLSEYPIEGNGFWDYLSVDANTNRLYISHQDQVEVFDLNSKKIIAQITGLNRVHGIALAPDLQKGYISNGGDSSVVVIDLNTYKTLAKINIKGANPDAIVYDPSSKRVFTFNGGSSTMSVIDTKTDQFLELIPLDGKPEFAVIGQKGRLYCNIEDKDEISQIDTKTLKILNTWSISPGEGPSGLAYDAINQRLISVCDNELAIISDARECRMVAQVPIGDGPDGVAFDPIHKYAYSTNGEGTISVIGQNDKPGHNNGEYETIKTIESEKGARTIALNSKTQRLYTCTAKFKHEKTGFRRQLEDDSFHIIEIKLP